MTDFSDVVDSKRSIRLQIRAKRRETPLERREAADAALRSVLTDLVQRVRPLRLAGYAPTPGEPGGPELVDALLAALPPGGHLLLPVTLPNLDLDWARYTGTLAPGARWGLPEPVGPRLGRTAIGSVDMIIAPATAVDRTGVRLGQGGGCYDRALARVPVAVAVIAAIYDGELVDRLPLAPHDRRVGAVATPAGVVTLPADPS